MKIIPIKGPLVESGLLEGCGFTWFARFCSALLFEENSFLAACSSRNRISHFESRVQELNLQEDSWVIVEYAP